MSYSPQGSPSQDGYPQSGKPVGGYGGEDPPQRGKNLHQKQQQQASPVRVLPQGHLPKNNNPDKQSSHQNSHHHQQQQSIPSGVPSSAGYPQKDHYPESHSSLPGYQSSHNQPHQQQSAGGLSQGYHPKDNDLSNHQSPNQSHKQITSIQDPSPQQSLPKDSSTTHQLPSESSSKTQQQLTTGEAPVKQRKPSESSVEYHMDPPKNPNPTSSDFPVKDHVAKHLSQTNDKLTLQPTSAETNSKVDQQGNSHSLQEHTNGYDQKPHTQPQLPDHGAVILSRKPLPVPEGYPPLRSPTSPSKLEPRPKKGLLEKICCCFF